MKKEEFVALGISEELAAKAEAASLKELEGYATKEQLNTVNAENKSLKQSVADRDQQLEELRKDMAGDREDRFQRIGELKKNVTIPVVCEDERFTTRMAHETLISEGMRREKRKNYVDALAAANILDGFLAKNKNKEETI